MRVLVIFLASFLFVKGPEIFLNANHKIVERSIKSNFKSPLEKIGIRFPEVVMAQIALETEWLSSTIYKENNNLFGMKESSRHWDCGSNRGHAKYKSALYSLYDYRDWQKQMIGNRKLETTEDYLYFLDHLPGNRRYAEDPHYTDKLRYIINN